MNLLSAEKSPYLLQHKDNPVFWHAWNDAAFERAMLEDKPVFLSIGYSTCHWCHVMAHESFEDPATAAVLNANFVSVKVDREERPDVDAVYMAYVQATTGSGGWPMSVFLTPDRKPFYGGTYFPPAGRGGLPGFAELLRGLAEAWRTRRSEITASADSAAQFLNHSHAHAHAPAEPDESLLRQAADDILSRHDAVHGGFGGAPKFPMPHTLSFLLRVWKRAGRADALAAVERTLDAMAAGGIYDRIGGGFHRYSTDREWRVPHYEKMLYDQALLVPAYLEAYQAMKSARYAEVARQTLDYVLRDMTSSEGGFYSAEDADSLDAEGRLREGAYYEAAAQERAKLPRPHRDEKILTDWNGLMIAALADGARVLGEVRYLNAARRAERFIEERLRRPDGTLLHRYCDGQAAITATLDDHAFFMRGLLALYDATLDASYLSRAEALAQALSERFFDAERPGFFMTERGAADLIARPRSEYDGALPAGGSAAVHALVRLSALTGDERWRGAAERVIRQMSSELAAHASGYSAMLSAVDAWVSAPVEVTLGADALDETAIGMIKEINSRFLPDRVVRLDASRKQGGGTAAHLCRDRRCLAPVRSAGELAAQLDAGS